jgi:hypothetical protein
MNSSSENVAASNEINDTSSGAIISSSLSSHDGIMIIVRIRNNCNNLEIFIFKSFVLINSHILRLIVYINKQFLIT